jgi:hypothetical protein
VPDVFVEHGKQADMRAAYDLHAAGIAARALAAFPGAVVPAAR